jgi:hypothetical protein
MEYVGILKLSNSVSLLDVVSEYGYVEILRFLLDQRSFRGWELSFAFSKCVRNNHLDCVQFLLDREGNKVLTSDNLCSPVSFEIARLLLETSHVWGDGNLKQCLREAVNYGHTKIVELFLNYGVVIDNIVDLALSENQIETGEFLLNRGFVISEIDYYSLYNVVYRGRVDLFSSYKLDNGENFLRQAVWDGDTDLVKFLLDIEVDPCCITDNILYHADQKNYTKILELLSQRGVQLEYIHSTDFQL